MVFSYAIETPINTPFQSPQITHVDINRGVIHHWEILFPAGAMGEHRIRINKGGQHIMPRNPLGYIMGNDYVFRGDDFIDIKTPPYQLDILSWNLDTIYTHTVYINIFIKPIWTFSPYSETLMGLIDRDELTESV